MQAANVRFGPTAKIQALAEELIAFAQQANLIRQLKSKVKRDVLKAIEIVFDAKFVQVKEHNVKELGEALMAGFFLSVP